MKDLAVYTDKLHGELHNQQPFRTFNRDIRHAAAITCAAFRYAKGRIRLLSHKLDRALYGDSLLNGHVAPFLDKEGASLHILVESDISIDHPIWNFIRSGKYGEDRLTIKRVPVQVVERYEFNYLVADDFGFRFENDRKKYAAVASFYEPDSQPTIDDLIDFFDKLERESSDIQHEGMD